MQTGLFARCWGNEQTPPFTPREPVIAAGTRHDDGWKGGEAHPSIDPSTGQPWQVYRLTPHEHVPLYRRGIAVAAAHDPITGVLVSMHGAGTRPTGARLTNSTSRGATLCSYVSREIVPVQILAETRVARPPALAQAVRVGVCATQDHDAA